MDLMLSENPQSSRLIISNKSADFKLLSSNQMTELQQETQTMFMMVLQPFKITKRAQFPRLPFSPPSLCL